MINVASETPRKYADNLQEKAMNKYGITLDPGYSCII